MKFWQKLATTMAFVVGCTTLPAVAAESVKQIADATLKGDKVCTECHDESEKRPILAMYKTKHGVKADSRTPGCQTCHGASEEHAKKTTGKPTDPKPDRIFVGKNKSDAKVINEACVSCHQSGNRMHWTGSQHESRDVACTNCHQVHTHGDKVLNKETQQEVCFTCHKNERAQSHRKSSHPVGVKMACSDCHNTHGSTGPKLLAKNTVNETCYSCHTEKRGPFLWDHAPASENCATCHTPHGSNIAPMLKAKAPWLCQECHAATNHPSTAYSGRGLPPSAGGVAVAQQMVLKACVNCHQPHGSNHPSGARFTR